MVRPRPNDVSTRPGCATSNGSSGNARPDLLDLVAELEGAAHDLNLLQAALAMHGSRTWRSSDRLADASGPIPPDADCLSTAASHARRHLGGIVLPIEACHDLEELDRKIESGAWGRAAWRALRALDAFARDDEFGPGFWQWCDAGRSSYAWPASPRSSPCASPTRSWATTGCVGCGSSPSTRGWTPPVGSRCRPT